MVKTIKELKILITDGMVLKSKRGHELIIKRYPNNIIMIQGRSISWKDLQELLANSEYELVIPDSLKEQFFPKRKSNTGGARLGAGRKKVADKKKIKSFSLSPKAIEILKQNIKQNHNGKISQSEYIENLILKNGMPSGQVNCCTKCDQP